MPLVVVATLKPGRYHTSGSAPRGSQAAGTHATAAPRRPHFPLFLLYLQLSEACTFQRSVRHHALWRRSCGSYKDDDSGPDGAVASCFARRAFMLKADSIARLVHPQKSRIIDVIMRIFCPFNASFSSSCACLSFSRTPDIIT